MFTFLHVSQEISLNPTLVIGLLGNAFPFIVALKNLFSVKSVLQKF